MESGTQPKPRIADVSRDEIPALIERNLWEFFEILKAWPRLELHDEPAAFWFRSGVPFALLNGVVRTQFEPDAADGQIAAQLAQFSDRQLPMLWWVGPLALPADLTTRLAAHGAVQIAAPPGMAIDLDALAPAGPLPDDLRIDVVADGAALRQWFAVLARAFELPDFATEAMYEAFLTVGFAPDGPLRHYLARRDGTAVATASLCLGNEVAGIYNVATLPDTRRRGIGAAVTRAALAAALAAGYHVGVLESSPMGLGVYRQLGFDAYCTFYQYFAGPPEESGH